MLVIVGYIIVIASVLGGFALAGGHIAALMQPLEFLMIGGAAAGMWLGGSDGHALSGLVLGLGVGWVLLRRLTRQREPWQQIALQSQAIRLQPRFFEEP